MVQINAEWFKCWIPKCHIPLTIDILHIDTFYRMGTFSICRKSTFILSLDGITKFFPYVKNQHRHLISYHHHHYTMPTISSFNIFSLRDFSQNTLTGIRLQEIVDYAKSHFRAIMGYICHKNNKTDRNRKIWVQLLLNLKLVRLKPCLYFISKY